MENKKVVEYAGLPSTRVWVILLPPDAPSVDLDHELIEGKETMVGLACNHKEVSPTTKVSSETTEVTSKRTSNGEVLARHQDFVLAGGTVHTSNVAFHSFHQSKMEDDMKKLKMSLLSLFAALFLLGLVACEKEGPMEKAGKQIDEAVEKTEEAIKEKTE